MVISPSVDSRYPIAERVRKVGGSNLHSIGKIARVQRLQDNDAEYGPAGYAGGTHRGDPVQH